MRELDYSQFQCPTPVVETRKQLLAHPGENLLVRVADSIACQNISRLAASQGYTVDQHASTSGYTLMLRPDSAKPAVTTTAAPISGQTILFCKSDRMGDGDDELGRILLRNFFMTMIDLERLPDLILFVNSGVKLVCSDSEALEALGKLGCRGVDIAACGLCLDFYHLKEKLQVGRVTNMLEIAESQLKAGRVLTP